MPHKHKPSRWEFALLRMWHAALAGGFVVAFATGDEDTYRMHLFAGWWVVGAVALRLAAGLAAPAGSPLALTGTLGRKPVMRWMAALLLAVVAAAGLSGVAADVIPMLEDPHEAVSQASAWVVLAHVAVVVAVFRGRWLLQRLKLRRPAAAVTALMLAAAFAAPALAASSRDAILAGYAKEAKAADPGFSGFSAARGEALFRSRNTANPEVASCTACHTEDPTRPGRHHKTGRAIDPVAVSANPKRFTEADKVDERFGRDCKNVLGRPCTPAEKGDYITFMASR